MNPIYTYIQDDNRLDSPASFVVKLVFIVNILLATKAETHFGRIQQEASSAASNSTTVFLFIQENQTPVPDVMTSLGNRLMYLLRADTV